MDKAIKSFERNLEKLRKLYPVKTVCMHGSPLSKWDNRDLWKRYDYRDYGIIAEPYFDIDFDEVLYLTDTGRRWDGDRVSVRDKIVKTEVGGQMSVVEPQRRKGRKGVFCWFCSDPEEKTQYLNTPSPDGRQGTGSALDMAHSGRPVEMRADVTSSISRGREVRNLKIRGTKDIIEAAEDGVLPDKIMINVHPQRWTDDYLPWVKELVGQNVKNVVKRAMLKFRDSSPQRRRGRRGRNILFPFC